MISRRTTLKTGLAGIAGLGLTRLASGAVFAQTAPAGQSYATAGGEIVIYPVQHASFVMTVPDMVIYVDPVGEPSAYAGLPDADLILITHEHGDHFNADTLAALNRDSTRLITNPAVHGMLAADLQAKATQMANGENATVGEMGIEAVPAYNMTADRLNYHPPGRDNGYLLTIDGRRVYIAGDTEDTPEMRSMKDIDISFVPMNLPYTMDIDQASSAVIEFAPKIVYPYHYQTSDIQSFAANVEAAGGDTQVIFGNWY